MTWVKFHDELRRGAKRGLPRATRFIYLELSLEARPKRGVVDLPIDMSAVDGVADLLGGNRDEIEAALKKLTAGPDPMVIIEGEEGRLRLVIPKWSKWNSVDATSAERSRRHRGDRASTGSDPPSDLGDSPDDDQTDGRNGDATEVQRVADGDGTLLDQSRVDKRRSWGGSARAGEPEANQGPDLIAFAADLAAEEAKAGTRGIGTTVTEHAANGRVPTPKQREALRAIYARRTTTPSLAPLGDDELWVSERWREARRRSGLPDGEPDRKHVAALWAKSSSASASAKPVAGWKPPPREIVAFWIKSYLADKQERAGGIVDQKYPLALLVSRAGETYGLPRKQAPQSKAPTSAPAPEPVRAPPSADVRRLIQGAMDKMGAPPASAERVPESRP